MRGKSAEVGNRYKNQNGYWGTRTEDGWVADHRFIMETHLERSLEKGEKVEFVDGDKDNLNLSNLRLVGSPIVPFKDRFGADVVGGCRVRISRDENQRPSRGTWSRYRNKLGEVLFVKAEDHEACVKLDGKEDPTWFADYELVVLDEAH